MIKQITVKAAAVTGAEEVVILPVPGGEKSLPRHLAESLDRTSRRVAADLSKNKSLPTEIGSTQFVALGGKNSPEYALFAGIGRVADLDAEGAAHAGAAAFEALPPNRFKSAHLMLDGVLPENNVDGFLVPFLRGFLSASYRYSIKEKPTTPTSIRRVGVLSNDDRTTVTAAVKHCRVVSEFTTVIRDMVNTPANELTPIALAERAEALCRAEGVTCRVLSQRQIQREKMGAILAVARGSREQPRLIVMEHNVRRTDLPFVCMIGKGVTFDSGGVSLKPWERMNEMKGDMAGAAVTIATLCAAARLSIPVRLAAVVPAVENMPDGSALRPGDVVRARSGKTIEILSTDAEGRLILADAISYARDHFDPDVTVDVATLTGAVLIALGTRIAGVVGNTQKHIDRLVAAGERAGEPVWQLPLDRHFRRMVRGEISDYKNFAGRNGSTITAAALLAEFAGNAPWIHVDIAGTFWNDSETPPQGTKGATGYGLSLMLQFLSTFA